MKFLINHERWLLVVGGPCFRANGGVRCRFFRLSFWLLSLWVRSCGRAICAINSGGVRPGKGIPSDGMEFPLSLLESSGIQPAPPGTSGGAKHFGSRNVEFSSIYFNSSFTLSKISCQLIPTRLASTEVLMISFSSV